MDETLGLTPYTLKNPKKDSTYILFLGTFSGDVLPTKISCFYEGGILTTRLRRYYKLFGSGAEIRTLKAILHRLTKVQASLPIQLAHSSF